MAGKHLIIVVAIALVVDGILAMGLWFGWPEKIQRSTNGSGHVWLLLDMAGLPRIEENCLALAKGYFIAGIVLATLGAICAYLFVFRDYVMAYIS
jgi:hypothetical protein